MIRDIVIYPDSRLLEVSSAVEFDQKGLEARLELEQDLKDTMAYAKGVAIAAVQVGVLWRCMVIGNTAYWDPIETARCRCINTDAQEEGCLSLPGVKEKVFRPCNVVVSYFDATGKSLDKTLKGLEAQAALHEMEHMDGRLLTSSMNPVKLESVKTRLKKLHRAAKQLGVSTSELVYGSKA